MRRLSTLARRLFSRFTTKPAAGVPNPMRFRPRLEQCEDRTVPTPVVTIQALADATEGGAAGTFRFTRTETSGSLYVSLMASGTATSGSDYTSIGSANFANGQATVDVNVTATDDSAQEGTETLILGITPFYIYTVGTPSSAFIFLYDNDTPVVTVSKIADTTEGGTAGTFRFTRTGSNYSSLTANFTVSGTATSGSDFTSLGTSVTFGYGQSTVDVTLTALTDNRVEGTETATLTLGTGSGYVVGTANAATADIADDPPVVSVTATDATEGGATGSFVFTRSGGKLSEALPVVYWVTGTAAEEDDYDVLSGLTSFYANQTTVTVTLTAVNDTDSEYEETVDVEIAPSEDYPIYLGDNGYVIDGGFAAATIHDNETPVITAYKTSDAFEGQWDGGFAFYRTGNLASALTVNIGVSGTATSGTDFTALGTTVTFAAGEVEATKTVVAPDDSTSDNNETVILTLQSGSGYTVGTTDPLTVTIEDADPEVTATTTAHATEGGADGSVTFTRSGASMLPLTVNFTLGGTASDMTDYIAPPLSAYFAPGSATAAVSITSLNDDYAEGTETVVVTLQSGTGYTVGTTNSATANITDDDTYTPPSTPIITVLSMYDAVEGANVGRFRLTRDGDVSSALTVSVSVSGTATSGTDYTALPSTVTFAAGETSADLTVTADEDNTAESTETVQLSLLTGSGYVLGAITTALVNVFEANASAPAANLNPGNGLFARYYNTTELFDLRTARVDEKIEFNWGLNAPTGTAVGTDHFSVMWVGKVKAEYDADYTFYTNSDDGIRVWVNNQLLIDDWNEHPSTSRTANAIVPFTAGQMHDIRVEYFEGLGGAEVTLSWSNSVVAKKVPVPKSQLYAIAFDIDVNADGDITDTVDGANDYLPGYEGSVAKVSTTSAFNATADAYRGQNMKLVLDGVGTGTTDITKVEFVITNPTQYAGYASNKSSPIVTGPGYTDDFSFSKMWNLRTVTVHNTTPPSSPTEEPQNAAQNLQLGAAWLGGSMEANKTWVHFYAKDYGAWAKVEARVYLGGATPAYTLNLTTSRDTEGGNGDKLADKWEILMARRQATQIGDAPYTLTQSLALTLRGRLETGLFSARVLSVPSRHERTEAVSQ